MATTTGGRTSGQHEYSGAAVGFTAFAGILMVMVGIFHAIQGIVALANDDFFVVGEEYVFEFDVTAWGWIHLIAGVIVAFAGAGCRPVRCGDDRTRRRRGVPAARCECGGPGYFVRPRVRAVC